MPQTIRFPAIPSDFNNNAANIDAITILSGVAQLDHGGAVVGADIGALRTAGQRPGESPYISLVIEFTATAAFTIGDGVTETIGLYGERDFSGGFTKYLLGNLGYNFGASLPQIVIGTDGVSVIGFAQIIQAEAAYDRLTVGCPQHVIAFGGPLLTVKVRPFVLRDYAG